MGYLFTSKGRAGKGRTMGGKARGGEKGGERNYTSKARGKGRGKGELLPGAEGGCMPLITCQQSTMSLRQRTAQ